MTSPSPFASYIDDPCLRHEWIGLGFADDFAEGTATAVEVMGEPLVVWRADGEVHVWRDHCVHRGARLSPGRVHDGCLECPYHAWRFGPDGRCVAIPTHPELPIPARARIHSYRATEHLGLVWMCFAEPARPAPPDGHWFERTDLRHLKAGPYSFAAPAPRVMENFFDFGHLPVVHDGLLASRDLPAIGSYEVTSDEAGLHVRKMTLNVPSFQGQGEPQSVAYSYDVYRPLTVQLYSDNEAGPEASVWFTVTPVDAHRSVGWIWLLNDLPGVSDADNVAFEDAILAGDVPIVESQYPPELPLDPGAELHLPSDKLALAYRRWLKALGLRLGVQRGPS